MKLKLAICVLFTTMFCSVSYAQSVVKSAPIGSGTGAGVKANILLLLDSSNSMDRKVAGNITFDSGPRDIAFDSTGNIYVGELDGTIHKFDSSMKFIKFFGGEDQVDYPEDDRLESVYSMVMDSRDYLYVADENRGVLQRFNTDGDLDISIEVDVRSVAVDSSDNVYIVSGVDVIHYDKELNHIKTWRPESNPSDVFVANDKIHLVHKHAPAPLKNHNIGIYDLDGNQITQLFTRVPFFPFPIYYKGITVLVASNGHIFVVSKEYSKVYEYDSSYTFVKSYGVLPSSNIGDLKQPWGIAQDASGNIWIADEGNKRIQNITTTSTKDEDKVFPVNIDQTRMDQAKSAIKSILANSEIIGKANFGMTVWDDKVQHHINVSPQGASQINEWLDLPTDYHLNTYLGTALEYARDYLKGSSTPIDSTKPCQQTVIIVLSDGKWHDPELVESVAQDLYKNMSVKVFAIGMHLDNPVDAVANYEALSKMGGTAPDSPVYANNEASIIKSVTDFVNKAIEATLSFSAPTIVPGPSGSDYIMQSVFNYNPDHQWKGHLYKYNLDSNGGIGTLGWDAGAELNKVPYTDRNIWTVHGSLPISLNNFTKANVTHLQSLLGEHIATGMAQTTSENLIDFVRGRDVYNEYPAGIDEDGVSLLKGERWKLSDIYNSRSVVVGPPAASISSAAPESTEAWYRYNFNYKGFQDGSSCGAPQCRDRKEVVYAGSNGGMLHAFDAQTGKELWAFIPPSVIPNFQQMIASSTGTSVGIYGVDGSITVKDIFDGTSWRTILIGGLRQGGHSYFALDVTNPTSPTHLFTIANDIHSNSPKVSHWDASGVRTTYGTDRTSLTSTPIPSEVDFRSLGEAWATPVVINMQLNDGTKKWVALINGGFNGTTSASYGSTLFLLDINNDGKLLQDGTFTGSISLGEGNSTNTIVNAFPSEPTVITSDSSNDFNHHGAYVYLTDLDGVVWKVNLSSHTESGKSALYDYKKVFDGQTTRDNGRLSYFRPAIASSKTGLLRAYYGTGDLTNIDHESTTMNNRIYAFKDYDFPNYDDTSDTLEPADLNDISSAISAVGGKVISCVGDTGYAGWRLDLDANEKVTGKITAWNGEIIVPRYTPNSLEGSCALGTAKISEHQFECGNAERTVNLGHGIPTEAVVYNGKIYMGVSTDIGSGTPLPTGFDKVGNLIVGTPVNSEGPVVQVESWEERFE